VASLCDLIEMSTNIQGPQLCAINTFLKTVTVGFTVFRVVTIKSTVSWKIETAGSSKTHKYLPKCMLAHPRRQESSAVLAVSY
jgi:hypothetical protein